MELLSPAGSPEALQAAVCAGANAAYMGFGQFNARRGARNFTREDFAEAVSYCHLRGVKVYLTLNTLCGDREMEDAAALAIDASKMGADAVLVQDMGLVRVLRQVAPDLPVHASTQMTVHNLDGVKEAADLGMTRVVLSRELSRRDIASICNKSPIEIEVFVHGALCMCYSGQCFMSSVIGGRSGNRGMCAQPCRLAYGWADRADGHPLSLKDLSLAGHLQELQDMGVACAKIEGRMKRPEYVYIVTKVYADALREKREPSPEDIKRLEQAFSRQGFTEAYYQGQKGPDMFGIRGEPPEPKDIYAAAKAAYSRNQGPGVPVKFYAMVQVGQPVQVGVEDPEGRVATAAGELPELARTRATTKEDVKSQISKTGGTPFTAAATLVHVENGLSVPVATLNGLRRQVLEDLTKQRTAIPERRHGTYHMGAKYPNRRGQPAIQVSLRKMDQLTKELQRQRPDLIILPTWEISAHQDAVKGIQDNGIPVACVLPRICLDRERDVLRRDMDICREMGIRDAYIGNLGMIPIAREMGFTLRGDFGLQVFNSQAVKEYKRLGFSTLTASFELKLAQIRDLAKAVDTELIAYGRFPLMIMENCILKNRGGGCICDGSNSLTDRKGVRFPVEKTFGCRNELFNANKLFLADKQQDLNRTGVSAIRLLFTTETGVECTQVLDRYRGKGNYTPSNFTRGLYYRDVE